MDNPTPEQVKEIYKYCYLFFTKHIKVDTDQEYYEMLTEAKQIRNKYPFKLCEDMIIENMEIINRYWMEKKEVEE